MHWWPLRIKCLCSLLKQMSRCACCSQDPRKKNPPRMGFSPLTPGSGTLDNNFIQKATLKLAEQRGFSKLARSREQLILAEEFDPLSGWTGMTFTSEPPHWEAVLQICTFQCVDAHPAALNAFSRQGGGRLKNNLFSRNNGKAGKSCGRSGSPAVQGQDTEERPLYPPYILLSPPQRPL